MADRYHRPIVLRRPPMARGDKLVLVILPTAVAALPALVCGTWWLVRWSRGAPQPWLPILIPGALWLALLLLLAVTEIRRRMERIVIRPEQGELQLRRVIIGDRGLLWGPSISCTIPFAVISAVQTVDRGHMPPGVRIVLVRADRNEILDLTNDEFDRGRLSNLLAAEAGFTPTRGEMPHH